MRISRIELENYKGIKEIIIPLKMLNIFVGKNNTGKTTVLDALYLVFSTLSSKNNRNVRIPSQINFLLYYGSKNSKINLVMDSGENLCCELMLYEELSNILTKLSEFQDYRKQKFREYILNDTPMRMRSKKDRKENPDIDQIQEGYINQLEIDFNQKYSELMKKAIFIKINWNNELILEGFIQADLSYEKIVIFDSLISRGIRRQQDLMIHYRNESLIEKEILEKINPFWFEGRGKSLLDLYQIIFKANKKKIVENSIMKRLNEFESLDEVEGQLWVTLKENKQSLPIPLSLMGDGFQALIKCQLILSSDYRLILFDEIEVSLHPGYIKILSEELLNRIDNDQILITTHSLEFIKELFEKIKKKNKEKDAQLIRMKKDLGGIDRELLYFDDIQNEMNTLEVDLRGY